MHLTSTSVWLVVAAAPSAMPSAAAWTTSPRVVVQLTWDPLALEPEREREEEREGVEAPEEGEGPPDSTRRVWSPCLRRKSLVSKVRGFYFLVKI